MTKVERISIRAAVVDACTIEATHEEGVVTSITIERVDHAGIEHIGNTTVKCVIASTAIEGVAGKVAGDAVSSYISCTVNSRGAS